MSVCHCDDPKPEALPASTRSALPWLLPPGEGGVTLVAKLFRALGDPNRLRLLEFLRDGEHTVGECVAHIGLSQGRVSSHLACLANCASVQVRREGRFVFYQVTDPRVTEIIRLARAQATDNFVALAACMEDQVIG